MVEMDGDEMTRIIWAFIKEKVMGSCLGNRRVSHKWSWRVLYRGTGGCCTGNRQSLCTALLLCPSCLSIRPQEAGGEISTASGRTWK